MKQLEIYLDKDIDTELIKSKKIAVIGLVLKVMDNL